jgi:hypothetical protein
VTMTDIPVSGPAGPLSRAPEASANAVVLTSCPVDGEHVWRTKQFYEVIAARTSIGAIGYYRAAGLSEADATELLEDTKKFLAAYAAGVSMEPRIYLVAPPAVQSLGWPGLVLQFHDWLVIAAHLGVSGSPFTGIAGSDPRLADATSMVLQSAFGTEVGVPDPLDR